MSGIRVQNITKRFGDFVAVSDLSLVVESGEVLGLLGPNGAGKSTLIRMLTTLLKPTSGSATIAGRDIVSAADEVRSIIGLVPQGMTTDLDLTPIENLSIFASLYGVPRGQRRQQITRLLDEVGLARWAHTPMQLLSGGMRRRVEIARGVIHQPGVLFLDEPTTGLDPVARRAIWDMLGRLRSERGLTVLMTTHYMDEAEKLCDRVAIINRGRVMALDSPLRLKSAIRFHNRVDVSFGAMPSDWSARLETLPGVESVKADGKVFTLIVRDGPQATMDVLIAARTANVMVESLTVIGTTLDDVFAHIAGRDLRGENTAGC